MIAKDMLPQALATVLICQTCQVGTVYTNTIVNAAATDSDTGSQVTHTATINGVT